jgi:signal transduction histidine kinase
MAEAAMNVLATRAVRGPASLPAIWIVDDSPVQGQAFARALSGAYNVSVYTDGAAVLEALAGGPALPNVLVLDWHMPELTGIDVCACIRRTKDRVQLPILMLTALGVGRSAAEALQAGANDFVTVPVSPIELRARISALVEVASLHAQLAAAEGRLRVEADFRERFMGMLAHDLRQPLNSLWMASQVLSRSGAPEPKLASLIEVQLRSIQRMRRMIAELMDFTRIRPETGMPIERQTTDLAATVRSNVDEILLSHPDQPIEISLPESCIGSWDPDRLAQVCSNLLNNAMSITPLAPGSQSSSDRSRCAPSSASQTMA